MPSGNRSMPDLHLKNSTPRIPLCFAKHIVSPDCLKSGLLDALRIAPMESWQGNKITSTLSGEV